MKRSLVAILALASLAGCTSLTNAKFDNIEAVRYVDVSVVTVEISKHCDVPNAVKALLPSLVSLSAASLAYSNIKPNNENIIQASKIIYNLTTELNTRYSTSVPSPSYCRLKLASIAEASTLVATSLAKKD